ncbi:MAG: hypothetical protein ACM3SS_07485 [Rhodospirillaceae bacterium]
MNAGSRVPDFKRRIVLEYLSRHFRDSKLGETYDHEQDLYVFRLSQRGSRLLLAVSGDFFEKRRPHDISRHLEHFNVAKVLLALRDVILTNQGIRKQLR